MFLSAGGTHQVIDQKEGFALLFAVGGGSDGWVAKDHLNFKIE
jgi:hypothetical protein